MLHEIAFHFKIPCYLLYEEMPYDELLRWLTYFDKRPVGWREDNRIFHLINTVRGLAGGNKINPWDIFPSLYPVYHGEKKKEGFDVQSFKKSAMFQNILFAKDGVQLDVN